MTLNWRRSGRTSKSIIARSAGGIWLDCGELDKIIERSTTRPREQAAAPQPPIESYGGYQRQDHGHSGKHGYRRKSWLQELFD